ncbi:uncharacterized protein P884DRAFT_254075, partial [Thermothelomyces heterothallicus CBS 202.75]|uniref:uncharacterized protein n=1 Tax=Thermothelomyces heterothallicus CBS 202.75 TaxID=1149848 RepID=UPI0037435C52
MGHFGLDIVFGLCVCRCSFLSRFSLSSWLISLGWVRPIRGLWGELMVRLGHVFSSGNSRTGWRCTRLPGHVRPYAHSQPGNDRGFLGRGRALLFL